MKKIFLWVWALASAFTTFAQADSLHTDTTFLPRYRIALFAPLYLDSAYDATGHYRYDQDFPKFINPGLEFYEGAQLAIDSLQKEGLPLDIHVYDTRSATNTLRQILEKGELDSTNLIIGHVNMTEAAWLAYYAKAKKIPFINANLPNGAGTADNPDYVIINATLFTHCEGIYKFMQKNFALTPIVVFTRPGAQENRLKAYFTQIGKSTPAVPLKLQYVNLPNNFTAGQLKPYLDPDRTTVCLAGSLDVNFGLRLCQQLASIDSTNASLVMGMPTWDILDFSAPEYAGLEIMYSTPFYIPRTDSLASDINDYYRVHFYSRPSDMVFRGYETVYHFAHLLRKYGNNLSSNLGDKSANVFYDFNIQPVINPKTMTLDYFENKKLYFIKKVNGEVKAVF